jgi:BASS family bile acid:Na+ symporter
VPLQFGKVLEVVGVIMVPVVIGMVVRSRRPDFSERMGPPMKVFSAVVLAVFSLIAIVKEWTALTESFSSLGPVVLAFNLASLLVGYYLSRWAGLDKSIATAVSFEIGIHNSTLAIFVALSVLGNLQLALPAALYSVSMYLTATAFGFLVLRRGG